AQECTRQRAEAAPERLEIAHTAQFLLDPGRKDMPAEVCDAVVLAPGGNRLTHCIGSPDAREDGIVNGLEPWRVHETGRTADQTAPGKGEIGNGLQSARCQRPGPIAQPCSAF